MRGRSELLGFGCGNDELRMAIVLNLSNEAVLVSTKSHAVQLKAKAGGRVNMSSTTGCEDLQMVSLTLRVLHCPESRFVKDLPGMFYYASICLSFAKILTIYSAVIEARR